MNGVGVRGRVGRPRPLRILMVVPGVDTLGGMELQARALARALARRGARVSILSTTRASGIAEWLREGRPLLERHGRLEVVRIPTFARWTLATAHALFDGLGSLFLLARAPRPDVVYAVQWTSGVRASSLARLLDAPLVVKFAGGGAHGDVAAIGRLEDGSRVLETLREASAIACVSPQIEAEARSVGLARVLRIPNGIDLGRFAAPSSPEPGVERIVFVGALRREKQLGVLVRAFARVARERPAAELAIVGEGPEEAPTRALVAALGLEGRVRFLGRRGDVPAILARAHAFVLPSESEGLSNALLEALAARVPVVATDVEGNRAVVRHEVEALLVPPGDEVALARALARVLAEPALAAAFRAAGRLVAERHAMASIARDYEEAFRALRRRPTGALFRYLEGPPGLLHVAGRGLAAASLAVRRAVTAGVVAAKRALGVEGDLLRR